MDLYFLYVHLFFWPTKNKYFKLASVNIWKFLVNSKYFFIYRFGEYKLGNSLKFTYFFREYSLLVRTRNSVSEKFKKKNNKPVFSKIFLWTLVFYLNFGYIWLAWLVKAPKPDREHSGSELLLHGPGVAGPKIRALDCTMI